MVQHLPDARATVDRHDNDGLTAPGVAVIACHEDVASILERNDAFSWLGRDHNRRYTSGQELRYAQADRAIATAGRGTVTVAQPAYTPQATTGCEPGSATAWRSVDSSQ